MNLSGLFRINVGLVLACLAFTSCHTSADAHSWIEKIESIYGEGSSRVGMDTQSDSYLQRYFCPLPTLQECQPDPKHNIVLDESAMRPCRSNVFSDPKATVQPGTDVTLHWAGNGHVGNGQSDGTCVKLMIAPFEADPAYESFSVMPGGECLDFSITDTDGSQEPQGTITIPPSLSEGSYTMLWYWNFTEFWYSACIDIDITADPDVGSPAPTPASSDMDDGTIQVYLHNGCSDIDDPTQFCQQYTQQSDSYCMTDTDECGRSICYGLAAFLLPCPTTCPSGCPVPRAMYDDFSTGLDETKWLIAEKSWGGGANGFTNGGVVAENVIANTTAGTIIFNAHGNDYTGDVMGVNKDLTRQTTGVRTGGAIATREYLGAGSYEVRMKIAGEVGVCSAVWTFFYNDDDYCSSGEPIVNHEIDIELPGRPSSAQQNIDFSQALLNTWTGEIGSLYETGYTPLGKFVDDDSFHVWRFDWHTDPDDRRVEFHLDGEHLRTMRNDNIPFYAGRLWIGAWFPNGWAGEANFEEETMEIDYFKFTPYDQVFECPAESYPDFGWAPGTDVGLVERELCNPVSPSTSSPVSPSTPSPITNTPSKSPIGGGSYLNNGCSNLPSSFCADYISGSYCKDWQQDGCGRSICKGDSHSSLNPCPSPTTNSPNTPPSRSPSSSPSTPMTSSPTSSPSTSPSESPTPSPTQSPSKSPTPPATSNPTSSPNKSPSNEPTVSPALSPSRNPSKSPSSSPSTPMTSSPTSSPSTSPSKSPTASPTQSPSKSPTPPTTNNPTLSPRSSPSRSPSKSPQAEPSGSNPVLIYKSEGCTAFDDMDGFCSEYNGGYCKYWQSDGCGRSVCHHDNHKNLFDC